MPHHRIELDTSSPVPIYHQMVQQVRQLIDSGALGDGDTLESARSLSRRLRVSRDTVIHAQRVLVRDGYAQRGESGDLIARTPPPATRSLAS
ncbi:GntR family transcriptional regulator [Rhodococcus sp. MEB041]|uniref:GntR family transcriptional regulator n=1 Tax=Rhodococcus sp. MEB041 TaxID=3040323 RepID=UPI00254CF945|nr:GntR family transcriptional regulator [Rhodococcus sp. MEB041]